MRRNYCSWTATYEALKSSRWMYLDGCLHHHDKKPLVVSHWYVVYPISWRFSTFYTKKKRYQVCIYSSLFIWRFYVGRLILFPCCSSSHIFTFSHAGDYPVPDATEKSVNSAPIYSRLLLLCSSARAPCGAGTLRPSEQTSNAARHQVCTEDLLSSWGNFARLFLQFAWFDVIPTESWLILRLMILMPLFLLG